MRLFVVKLILSYEQKCKGQNFSKNVSMLKTKFDINSMRLVTQTNQLVTENYVSIQLMLIFNSFVYKSITLLVHILVTYFQSDQTDWDSIIFNFW